MCPFHFDFSEMIFLSYDAYLTNRQQKLRPNFPYRKLYLILLECKHLMASCPFKIQLGMFKCFIVSRRPVILKLIPISLAGSD